MKILSLKGIVSLFIILFSFSSCERYVTECATPTLSGNYLIYKIQIISVNNGTQTDTTIFVNSKPYITQLPPPFNEISTTNPNIELSNCCSILELSTPNQTNSKAYRILNCTPYYTGTLDLTYTYIGVKYRILFSILDDGLEHLTLESQEVYNYQGTKVRYRLFLKD